MFIREFVLEAATSVAILFAVPDFLESVFKHVAHVVCLFEAATAGGDFTVPVDDAHPPGPVTVHGFLAVVVFAFHRFVFDDVAVLWQGVVVVFRNPFFGSSAKPGPCNSAL